MVAAARTLRSGRVFCCAGLAAIAPVSLPAAELALPDASTLAVQLSEPMASYEVPVNAWNGQTVPNLRAEGAVTRRVWQITSPDLSALHLFNMLRDQLSDQGWQISFECETETCGGFDFRYGTDVLPEPDMHVDLGNFLFLSGLRKAPEGTEHLSLLVSRSSQKAFVQLVTVSPKNSAEVEVTATSSKNPTVTQGTQDTLDAPIVSGALAERLDGVGRAVLNDLTFTTGSAQLGEGPFPALEDLASYLLDHPERRVVLVGHTDAEGSLSGNVSLSRQRAASVVNYLVREFGVPRSQLEAEGIGFLSPLASNLTDEGRTKNRRVEAILASTQ